MVPPLPLEVISDASCRDDFFSALIEGTADFTFFIVSPSFFFLEAKAGGSSIFFASFFLIVMEASFVFVFAVSSFVTLVSFFVMLLIDTVVGLDFFF